MTGPLENHTRALFSEDLSSLLSYVRQCVGADENDSLSFGEEMSSRHCYSLKISPLSSPFLLSPLSSFMSLSSGIPTLIHFSTSSLTLRQTLFFSPYHQHYILGSLSLSLCLSLSLSFLSPLSTLSSTVFPPHPDIVLVSMLAALTGLWKAPMIPWRAKDLKNGALR